MTRKLALANLLKESGDMFSIEDISIMKKALNWYGDDDINDVYWFEHLTNIFEMYLYMQKSIKMLK